MQAGLCKLVSFRLLLSPPLNKTNSKENTTSARHPSSPVCMLITGCNSVAQSKNRYWRKQLQLLLGSRARVVDWEWGARVGVGSRTGKLGVGEKRQLFHKLQYIHLDVEYLRGCFSTVQTPKHWHH